MSNTYTIRCRCGQLRGRLKATRPSNRCVCYCTDCQAFARHLRAAGVLDGSGGSAIVQVPASNLEFTAGAENLACLRLTDQGMLRWYSACCQTPIGNTPADRRMAFVGLILTDLNGDPQTLDACFGPVTMRVCVNSATTVDKPAASGLLSGVGKVLAIIIRGRISGAYRRSPFFRPESGAPIAKPTVLSATEIAAAKRAA